MRNFVLIVLVGNQGGCIDDSLIWVRQTLSAVESRCGVPGPAAHFIHAQSNHRNVLSRSPTEARVRDDFPDELIWASHSRDQIECAADSGDQLAATALMRSLVQGFPWTELDLDKAHDVQAAALANLRRDDPQFSLCRDHVADPRYVLCPWGNAEFWTALGDVHIAVERSARDIENRPEHQRLACEAYERALLAGANIVELRLRLLDAQCELTQEEEE